MRIESGCLGSSKPFHLEGGHVFLAVCRGAEGGSEFDSLARGQRKADVEVHRKAEEAKDLRGSRLITLMTHSGFRESGSQE